MSFWSVIFDVLFLNVGFFSSSSFLFKCCFFKKKKKSLLYKKVFALFSRLSFCRSGQCTFRGIKDDSVHGEWSEMILGGYSVSPCMGGTGTGIEGVMSSSGVEVSPGVTKV